ncbi:MAG: hypothetical protein BWY56_01858 [Acidobacteria bacterium ADurb.Bin340]|nr:MAG: hypothetical protein BWY56_01858 [Acidobacteria bacterium ADurb.Bin340]
MPFQDPVDETRFAEAFRRARLLGLALCYGTIIPYVVVWFLAAFNGDGALLKEALEGAYPLPLDRPVVLTLLALATAELAAVPFVARGFAAQARRQTDLSRALQRLLNGHVIACALLEAVAVYGLVMGFAEGPGTAPLTLAMLLVPAVAYPFLVHGEPTWRAVAGTVVGGANRG